MTSYSPKYCPYGLADASRRIISNPVFRDYIEFLQYGCESDGKELKMRISVQPGGGTPLHRHYIYAESFKCVAGRLGVEFGRAKTSRTVILKPGEEAYVPAGEWHRFFSPDDSVLAEFDCGASPAPETFEQALCIVYGLARDGKVDAVTGMPSGFVASCLFLSMSETEFPEWGMWLLGRLASLVDVYAGWTGEKDRLLRKYYGQPIDEFIMKDL